MPFFKPIVFTILCFGTLIVTSAPTVIDPVLAPRSNETYAHSQTRSARAIVPLQLPTIPDMTKRLGPLVLPDKSLYYSGPGPSSYTPRARIYAQRYNLKTVMDYGDPAVVELATNAGDIYVKEYWRRMSAAFSYATKGRAYVMLPGEPTLGVDWFKGTLWDTIEWPILEQNSAVQEILRLAPTGAPPESGINIKPIWTNPPRGLQ